MLPFANFNKNINALQGGADSHNAEEKLQFTNILLHAEMEASPDGILVLNSAHTHIILFNHRFIEMMGISPALVRAGIDAPVLAQVAALMKDQEKFFARIQYLNTHVDETGFDELETIDGRFIERHTTPLHSPSGVHLGRIMFFHDITERIKSQEKLQFSNNLFEAEMESSPDGILVIHPDTKRVILFNHRFLEISGISPELAHAGDNTPLLEAIPRLIKDSQTLLTRIQYLNDHAEESDFNEIETIDGRFIECHTTPLRAASGQYLGRVWFFHDITKRKKIEKQILQLARDDTLTGLANRRTFIEDVQEEITRTARSGMGFALLYLDLDYFKDINDTLGHPSGDLLLQAVAQRLKASVRATDSVARLGGDEFAILQTNIHEPADTSILAEKLIKTFQMPFSIKGNMVHSGASVGISVYGQDATTADTLLSNADIALYKAKAEGRGIYSFFNDAMATEVQARVTMSKEFRKAIEQDELFLLYQPQIEIETGRITGIEALVRWQHPERGVIGPDIFVPMAEKNALITLLSNWVVRAACRQAKTWLDEGILPSVIAVNISSIEFKSPRELEKNILTNLKESGLPPARLEIELTESGLMEASIGNRTGMLQRFRQLGIRISIDDFGTGYSSLSYLRQFHTDRIKIAQNFVLDIETVPADQTIVRAIIRLAQELDLNVIAEGVETEEQLRILENWGCKEVQGYYYSKPLTPENMTPLLRDGHISIRRESGANFTALPINPAPAEVNHAITMRGGI